MAILPAEHDREEAFARRQAYREAKEALGPLIGPLIERRAKIVNFADGAFALKKTRDPKWCYLRYAERCARSQEANHLHHSFKTFAEMQQYKSDDLPDIQKDERKARVLLVIRAILSATVSLTFIFLPMPEYLWIPLGIALPVGIVLTIFAFYYSSRADQGRSSGNYCLAKYALMHAHTWKQIDAAQGLYEGTDASRIAKFKESLLDIKVQGIEEDDAYLKRILAATLTDYDPDPFDIKNSYAKSTIRDPLDERTLDRVIKNFYGIEPEKLDERLAIRKALFQQEFIRLQDEIKALEKNAAEHGISFEEETAYKVYQLALKVERQEELTQGESNYLEANREVLLVEKKLNQILQQIQSQKDTFNQLKARVIDNECYHVAHLNILRVYKKRLKEMLEAHPLSRIARLENVEREILDAGDPASRLLPRQTQALLLLLIKHYPAYARRPIREIYANFSSLCQQALAKEKGLPADQRILLESCHFGQWLFNQTTLEMLFDSEPFEDSKTLNPREMTWILRLVKKHFRGHVPTKEICKQALAKERNLPVKDRVKLKDFNPNLIHKMTLDELFTQQTFENWSSDRNDFMIWMENHETMRLRSAIEIFKCNRNFWQQIDEIKKEGAQLRKCVQENQDVTERLEVLYKKELPSLRKKINRLSGMNFFADAIRKTFHCFPQIPLPTPEIPIVKGLRFVARPRPKIEQNATKKTIRELELEKLKLERDEKYADKIAELNARLSALRGEVQERIQALQTSKLTDEERAHIHALKERLITLQDEENLLRLEYKEALERAWKEQNELPLGLMQSLEIEKPFKIREGEIFDERVALAKEMDALYFARLDEEEKRQLIALKREIGEYSIAEVQEAYQKTHDPHQEAALARLVLEPEKLTPIERARIHSIRRTHQVLPEIDKKIKSIRLIKGLLLEFGVHLIYLVALITLSQYAFSWSSWVYWGLGGLTLINSGISYYLNKRVHYLMEEKEQERLLRMEWDHPLIGLQMGNPYVNKLAKPAVDVDGIGYTRSRMEGHQIFGEEEHWEKVKERGRIAARRALAYKTPDRVDTFPVIPPREEGATLKNAKAILRNALIAFEFLEGEIQNKKAYEVYQRVGALILTFYPDCTDLLNGVDSWRLAGGEYVAIIQQLAPDIHNRFLVPSPYDATFCSPALAPKDRDASDLQRAQEALGEGKFANMLYAALKHPEVRAVCLAHDDIKTLIREAEEAGIQDYATYKEKMRQAGEIASQHPPFLALFPPVPEPVSEPELDTI